MISLGKKVVEWLSEPGQRVVRWSITAASLLAFCVPYFFFKYSFWASLGMFVAIQVVGGFVLGAIDAREENKRAK